MSVRTSVLVLARAPRPGACKQRLEGVLGPEGCARLQALLITRVAAWARSVAPGRAYVAFAPEDAGPELSSLVVNGVQVFPQEGDGLGQRLAAATARALDGRGGPLLLAGTDLPQLSPAHAAVALADLADGCDVSFGPTAAGGCYLLGMRAALPALFEIDDSVGSGTDALWRRMLASGPAGLSIGLLRSERDLHTPADARAAVADPLTPPEIARALGGSAAS